MKNDPLVSFTRESEKELSGGLLRSLTVSILVMSVVFIMSALLFFHGLIWRAVIFGGSALVICIWVLWLIRHEQPRFAGVVLAAFLRVDNRPDLHWLCCCHSNRHSCPWSGNWIINCFSNNWFWRIYDLRRGESVPSGIC